MSRKRLSGNEVDARLNAYDEAIGHLSNPDAFDTGTEREQAKMLAKQLATQRDSFCDKYATRE